MGWQHRRRPEDLAPANPEPSDDELAAQARSDPAAFALLYRRYAVVIYRYCDRALSDRAAAEEVFVNKNPQSTLKLGQARGVVLMIAARSGIDVGEYAARFVKKAVVGVGNADKTQVHAMVQRLLPGAAIAGPDAADALAVAITHAHHLASARSGITHRE